MNCCIILSFKLYLLSKYDFGIIIMSVHVFELYRPRKLLIQMKQHYISLGSLIFFVKGKWLIMKKILLTYMVILALSFASGARAAPGDSLNDPIFISTPELLDAVRNGLDKYYKLSNDIDLTSYLAPGGAGYSKWGVSGWEPVGANVPNAHFAGELDGNGYKITGLWIDRSDTYNVGLFGYTNNAKISNLRIQISNAGIKGRYYVGGLAGSFNNGNIENCRSAGNVSGDTDVGGLVGSFYNGNIENCCSAGNVGGITDVGGLVGLQYTHSTSANVINCYATGNVSGDIYVGGLVGNQYSSNIITIMNSYATGNVSGNTDVGGLVGYQYSSSSGIITIANCYTTNNVSGNAGVGGLVGLQYINTGGYYSRYSITNCYVAGNITAVSSDNYAGVLVGYKDVDGIGGNTITSSYRYQLTTVNGAAIPANDADSAPNKRHGGIVTSSDLMNKATYTGNSWLFTDSTPTAGPWHWDNRNFPKLNMETENFPFPWNPLISSKPVITITDQPAANSTITAGSISGNISVIASVTEGRILSYQWYYNTINSNAGGYPINEATSLSFPIPTGLTAGTYYYYCVVSAADATPVFSNVARVTVEENRESRGGKGGGGCNAIGYNSYSVFALFGTVPFILGKRR